MKAIYSALMLGAFFFGVHGHAQGRPQITEEQRSCLEARIGKPGSGPRRRPDPPNRQNGPDSSVGIE